MTRIVFAILALSLIVAPFALPVEALPGDYTRVHAKGVTLSGQLSSDGKTLRTDDGNDWTVSNVDSIKGMEGRYISVSCRIDPGQRSIRVLFVVDQPKRSANLSDSAFRR